LAAPSSTELHRITHITWGQHGAFIIIAGVMLIIHSLSDKPSAENIEFISTPI
jgi:hypothetical protein